MKPQMMMKIERNIGLIRIKKSFPAEVYVGYLEKRLNSSNYIISIITDETSVMTKIGTLVSPGQQLRLAHGLQLAMSIFYIKCHMRMRSSVL